MPPKPALYGCVMPVIMGILFAVAFVVSCEYAANREETYLRRAARGLAPPAAVSIVVEDGKCDALDFVHDISCVSYEFGLPEQDVAERIRTMRVHAEAHGWQFLRERVGPGGTTIWLTKGDHGAWISAQLCAQSNLCDVHGQVYFD